MKSLSALPLDDDVIDRLLTFSPDFEALQATILASKSIYSVFRTHPNSIVKAVAYNLVGPALLTALSVVRYQPPVTDDLWFFGQADEEPTDVGIITIEEARKLSKNAVVVNTLQDLFSFRHKDQTSESSKLSPEESLRFKRAMYRLMLYTLVFPGRNTQYFDDPEDEGAEQIQLARKNFFTRFPTEELREIHTAGNFMTNLGTWVLRKALNLPRSSCEFAVVVGPALLLRAYQEQNADIFDTYFNLDNSYEENELLCDYVNIPLEEVCEERGDPPIDARGVFSCTDYLLDSFQRADDTCQQCGAKDGFYHWTESNWDVQNKVTLNFMPFYLERIPLPGKLSENPIDADEFRKHIRDASFPSLLNELFDLKTPEYASWNKQDLLCYFCVKKFMTEHLHLWLLKCKRQAGENILEDCWYGYECRTQSINLPHAEKYNHLCNNTRK
ncbi:hypothetical protein C8J57DRAFT_1315006 [Mycena rebaudengoi]|nr:hypothetical protein C8J57DRAFT_1315006 [Mycena rebaudengoi]